jgi:thioredoxin-like negative regulator of GroEL
MFAKIPAENFPKISMQCKISAVPTFLFYLAGKQVDRLDGANAAKLTQMVKNNVSQTCLLAGKLFDFRFW